MRSVPRAHWRPRSAGSRSPATAACRRTYGIATPRGDAWYAERGAMPSWIGIELMAQAIAAHVGLVARTRGQPPKRGVLLGTRQYRASETRFAADVELHITARVTYRDESGLASYDATIERGG